MVNICESSINVTKQDEPKELNGSSQNGKRRSIHLEAGLHGHQRAWRRDGTYISRVEIVERGKPDSLPEQRQANREER